MAAETSRQEDWYRADSNLTDATRLYFAVGDIDKLEKKFNAITARLNWLVGGVFLLEATIIGALLAVAFSH